MFNEQYFNYLKDKIETYTPKGYTSKVINEISFGEENYLNAYKEDAHTIIFFVRLGAASVIRGELLNVNQPLTINAFSEGGSAEVATLIMTELFNFLNVDEPDFELKNTTVSSLTSISTPTILPDTITINAVKRANLIMTGIVKYKEKTFKKSVKIDGIPINNLIDTSTNYNMQAVAQEFTDGSSDVFDEGSAVVYTIICQLTDNDKLIELLNITNTGNNPNTFTIELTYKGALKEIKTTTQAKLVQSGVSTNHTIDESTLSLHFMKITGAD